MAAGAVTAGPTPQEKCEGGKNAAAGKYYACIANAEKAFVLVEDGDKYEAAIQKCKTNLNVSWDKLEAKAETKDATCPSINDELTLRDFLDSCQSAVATVVSGTGPLPNCATCTTDLTTCQSDKATCNGNYQTCSTGLTNCSNNLTTCTNALNSCAAGSAAVGDVLSGKTFSSLAGVNVAGTMPNVGVQNVTPGTSAVTISQGYHNGTGSVAGDPDLLATNIAQGIDIFGVVGALTPSQPLKTGQTTCWSDTGASVPCFGSKQDGEIQAGAARGFTNNGDGTITDNKTGLMWEVLSNDNLLGSLHDKDTVYTWGNAFAVKIAGLNGTSFAGHNDWRLPNRRELESLLNLGVFTPAAYIDLATACAAGCTVATCSCTQPTEYWTSTTYEPSKPLAWVINFNNGDVAAQDKNATSNAVRAVRGGL
jgi:hypothetical protein